MHYFGQLEWDERYHHCHLDAVIIIITIITTIICRRYLSWRPRPKQWRWYWQTHDGGCCRCCCVIGISNKQAGCCIAGDAKRSGGMTLPPLYQSLSTDAGCLGQWRCSLLPFSNKCHRRPSGGGRCDSGNHLHICHQRAERNDDEYR